MSFRWIDQDIREPEPAPCNCHGHSTYCTRDGRCEVCPMRSMSSIKFGCSSRIVNITLLVTTVNFVLQVIKEMLAMEHPMRVNRFQFNQQHVNLS